MERNLKHKELKVYQIAFQSAMDIFIITKKFPREEIYSLVDQIRRSSRSVCANIVEGYQKRIYMKTFIAKLVDADGECSETIVWLDFAKDCSYISQCEYEQLITRYKEIGRLLGYMIKNADKFL